MNKLARFFMIAAVAMFLLLGLGFWISGGVDGAMKERSGVVLAGYAAVGESLVEEKAEVERLMKGHGALFEGGGYANDWTKRFTGYRGQLDAAKIKIDKIKAIIAENDGERGGELKVLLDEVEGARKAVAVGMLEILSKANMLVDLKKNAKGGIAKVKAGYGVIEVVDLEGLRAVVESTAVRWSGKREDLFKRFSSLEKGKLDAQLVVGKLGVIEDAIEGRRLDGATVLSLAKYMDMMAHYEEVVVDGKKRLGELMGQLDYSWDKMLVDLEIIEGSVVTFKAKYKTVKVSALLGEGEKGVEDTGAEVWQTIDKGMYEKMKENLGMAVAHKPAGMYDYEVIVETQPAGYRYMASKEGGRNRYGYWSGHGGGSFWMWYGQYHFMRSMFWGYGYSPIYYGGYSRYQGYRGSGRTYYGRGTSGGQRYGSKGSFAKSKYSGSKYAKSGGYKSSNYVKSGGKYRGSKYSSKANGGYRSSSYRSRSYSGSRSGGFGGK